MMLMYIINIMNLRLSSVAVIVTYKGVFIYFLRYSATGCTNQELRYSTMRVSELSHFSGLFNDALNIWTVQRG
jgi:hypothetical protein